MVSVVSKKRKSTGAERREMVSTELQTGPGIVVVVVVVVDVVVAVLVGSGGYMLKVPRMIILFSKQRILKQKKEKGKKKKRKKRMIKCQDYKWRRLPTTPTQGRQCHRPPPGGDCESDAIPCSCTCCPPQEPWVCSRAGLDPS